MNKRLLKYWAEESCSLLATHRTLSTGVSALYGYHELMEALESAKQGAVHSPVRLPALEKYIFDTDIQHFTALSHALICFAKSLAGRDDVPL